jgi:F-type H+-transporting ATPase subunit b
MTVRRWLAPALLLVLVGAFVAGAPAWAADEAHAEEGPSLIHVDVATAVVAIIVFVLLLVVLTKFAWRPILDGLQKREETIRRAVADAQKASDDARAMADEYKRKLDEATGEARAIAEEARTNAEAVRVRIEEDARKNAEDTIQRSRREIEQAKQAAIDEILGEVTAIATEAASRIVKRNLTAEDNAALVDDVVSQFTTERTGGKG